MHASSLAQGGSGGNVGSSMCGCSHAAAGLVHHACTAPSRSLGCLGTLPQDTARRHEVAWGYWGSVAAPAMGTSCRQSTVFAQVPGARSITMLGWHAPLHTKSRHCNGRGGLPSTHHLEGAVSTLLCCLQGSEGPRQVIESNILADQLPPEAAVCFERMAVHVYQSIEISLQAGLQAALIATRHCY